jgi:acetoin utilization deacetylase AcuC-like enzyme/GNAT superfamily N-acetyltransferase
MIRFVRVYDHVTEAERRRVREVGEIFRRVFTAAPGGAERIQRALEEKSKLGFEVLLITAEDERGRVLGFASVHYYPSLRYGYLDYVASALDARHRGLGSALYEAVREYLQKKGARGLFMDVPQDDPAVVPDPQRLDLARKRLRFYEGYGALPIVGTRYEHVSAEPDARELPFLVFDPLGRTTPLARADARKAVRAILTKKYGWDEEGALLREVVESFRDDPVRFREPRYVPPEPPKKAEHGRIAPLKLLVVPQHEIHHVRERGYVQRPVRVGAILRGLEGLDVERVAVRRHGEAPIRAVHDADYVSYLANLCASLEERDTIYPYVFPIRRPERKPRERATRAGYYCFDTFTPLSRAAWRAARDAVDCALSGADLLLSGERLVYALCRPPGHHAERRVFGGFCYFNNAAIAAHQLSAQGRVALLDIDFHHGNGSQDIFYRRNDVLFVSIHGHPNFSYPYFSGFADERGEGEGLGFNRNFPLPEHTDDARYLETLRSALREVRRFRPVYVVVSFGLDIMQGDPTGGFLVTRAAMAKVGEEIGRLDLPLLVVQEGGYSLKNLSRGSRAFFTGLTRTAVFSAA